MCGERARLAETKAMNFILSMRKICQTDDVCARDM
jgi:hypothetical protein